MRFSFLALLAALATPVASEIYMKEQFNDDVSDNEELSLAREGNHGHCIVLK
jgi:hypothetical protein